MKEEYLIKIENYYRKQDNFWKMYCIDFMKHLIIAFSRRDNKWEIMLLDKEFERYYWNIAEIFKLNWIIALDRTGKESHYALQQPDLNFLEYSWFKYLIEFQIINGDRMIEVFKRFAYLLNLSKKNDIVIEWYLIWNWNNEICIKKTTSWLERDNLNEDFLVDTIVVSAPKVIKLFDILVKNKKNYTTMKELGQRNIFKSKSDIRKTISDLRKFLWDIVENKTEEYKYLMTWNDWDNTIYFLQSLKEDDYKN